jgi:hypothetical protein
MLYAIHPWLNYAIDKMSKKSLFSACVWMFVLYNCINFILGGKYFASQLVGFVVYYFFVAYWKFYMPNISANRKKNFNLLFWGFVGFLGLIFTVCFLSSVSFDVCQYILKRLESFMNPFIVVISIAAFNIVKTKEFHSKWINKISSTSLLVFVISNNQLVCAFLKPVFFEKIYVYGQYEFIVIVCLVAAVLSFLCSIVLALGYMATLQKMVVFLGGRLTDNLASIGNKVYEILADKEERAKMDRNNRYDGTFEMSRGDEK